MKSLPFIVLLTILSPLLVKAQLSTNLNTTTPPSISSGRIGWWHLNGTAADSSGFNHTGTIVGATQAVGRFNYCYHFNGSSYIDVGNINLLSTGKFSVSSWIRSTSPYVSTETRMWISKLASTGGPLQLFLGNGAATSGGRGGAFKAWNGTTSLYNLYADKQNGRDGNWHNVTFTYQSGAQAIYFDGMLVKSGTGTTTLPNPTANIRIGGTTYATSNKPWIGDIDEVSLYNRVLSASEVRTLAKAPTLSTSPSTSIIVSKQTYDLMFIVEQQYQSNQAIASKKIVVDGVDRTTELLSGAVQGKVSYGTWLKIKPPSLTAGSHKVTGTFTLQNGDVLTSSATYRVITALN